MQEQAYVFIIFILNGILIGIVFDICRILRKSFKTPDSITYIEDILFGIISGLLVLFSIMRFNNGEIRLYLFLGIFIGLIFYLLIFSNVFIKISVRLVIIIKKILYFIIVLPIKYIYKFEKKYILRPITIICVNIKMLFRKIEIPKIKINTKIYKKNKK